jgi:histidinol-phosphate/aromatic aminotransferase/cobyric acid decarboxylase-like protein
VAEVRANRDHVYRWLESRGIPYVRSSANFILTRVGERAPEIAQRLRAEGILVRDWSYDPHLKGYLRFTIGSHAQTRRLLEELERQEHLIETRNATNAWRNFVTYSQTGWFA